MRNSFFLVILLLVNLIPKTGNTCTNFLVTKGASKDGSTMISYAADSHVLYGELYYRPAADYPSGSYYDVYEWDTGKYLGTINQVSHTYSVVGNMNEHQLTIGETTYGGRPELQDSTGIIDYGSLIYLTLQRAKTAREAIKTMAGLVDEYGYYSSGESMSIADANEVWIFEIIGNGPGKKGANWVARMIPDGYICAHANQARITTFPYQKTNNWFDTKQTTFNSKDVISYAKENGLYEGKDEDFSFSDVYAPVDFGGARFCEMRVWSFFKDFSAEVKSNNSYWDYVKGNVIHGTEHHEGPLTKENFATNRMPLWIKPDRKLSVHEVMNCMRDHIEGTELDMTKDFGAGPYGNPYRWRPLTWKVDGETYCNERVTATQQTGFSFVTQSRSNFPDPIGGILWFGVDDAASSVYYPVYCGSTRVSENFEVGNGDMITYSKTSAFWLFNEVSNFVYTRYNLIHPEVNTKQQAMEEKYIATVNAVDKAAVELYNIDKDLALEYITDFSVNTGNKLFTDWRAFYEYLFVKYSDGNIKEEAPLPHGYKYVAPKLSQPGYSQEWYNKLVKETGDQFKMKGAPSH